MTLLSKPAKGMLLSAAFICMACTALTAPAMAKQFGPFDVETQLRAQGSALSNPDLGTSGSDDIGNAGIEGRVNVNTHFNENALFFFEGRGVLSGGPAGFESYDTGTLTGGDSMLELRQSYFQFTNVGAPQGLLRLGRQKVREDYGLWWNQNFDAIKYAYDTTEFKGAVGVGQNMFSYRTGPNDFLENDEDLARAFAEGSWQYHYNQFFEVRGMWERDHSNLNLGDVQRAGDFDDKEGRLWWAGVRATGKSDVLADGKNKTAYRFDLLTMGGDEEIATNGACGANTCVTALNSVDVSGWGFDGAVDIPVPNMAPIIHLGYAFGTGDDAGGDNDSFRQPTLRGNFSRFGALSQSTENYGTVLRPRLSNIHVISAGATMPVLQTSDVGVIYRYYRLDELATGIDNNGVNDTLNGTDTGLGQGLDVLFNSNLTDDMKVYTSGVTDAALRSSLGFFRAGDAYGAADGEIAVRALVELKVGF